MRKINFVGEKQNNNKGGTTRRNKKLKINIDRYATQKRCYFYFTTTQ